MCVVDVTREAGSIVGYSDKTVHVTREAGSIVGYSPTVTRHPSLGTVLQ